jgi:hypothetical protein
MPHRGPPGVGHESPGLGGPSGPGGSPPLSDPPIEVGPGGAKVDRLTPAGDLGDPPPSSEIPDWDHIFKLGWYYRVPELQGFIEKWIKKLEDPDYYIDPFTAEDQFEAELRAQSWFRDNEEAWTTAEQQRLESPATWEGNLATHANDIEIIASNMGYPITGAEAERIADISLHGGTWADAEIERYILDTKYYEKPTSERVDPGAGSIRTQIDNLRWIANQNLVNIDNDVAGWAHDILSERMTVEQIKQQIQDRARSGRFSFLGDEKWDSWFGSGTTVRSFTNDLREEVADIWELNTSEVPLNHSFFNDNLIQTADDGTESFITSKQLRTLAMQNPDGTVNEQYKKTAKHQKRMADWKVGTYRMLGAI